MTRKWKKDLVGSVETPGVSVVSKAEPEKIKSWTGLSQGKEDSSSFSCFP